MYGWQSWEEVIMAKTPDEIVAEIDRKQNEEDLDLPRRAGEAVSKGAKRIYDVVVGKGAKDFEPKDTNYGPGPRFEDRDAVMSPVGGAIGSGAEMRSLNMGKKSAAPKASSDYKKGGKVSSASKRADGCCVKGKTKGRMV